MPTRFIQPSTFDANRIGEFGINSNDEISKVISKKRKFGELFGIGRKIIVDVIEDDDEDTYYEVLGFFHSIQQKRKSQQRIINGSGGGDSNNNGIMEILNDNNSILEI